LHKDCNMYLQLLLIVNPQFVSMLAVNMCSVGEACFPYRM